MAQGHTLKMEDIHSHPLGPLPWVLSIPDELLRKTDKASMAATLQKGVAVADQFSQNSAINRWNEIGAENEGRPSRFR